MLDLLISPFAKLFGVGLVAAGLFGFGYWKGYSSEHENFLAYKATIVAQVQQQEETNKHIAKQQELKTEGIINEYKARLATIRANSQWMQRNQSPVQLSETQGPTGTIATPSYPVLVGQCLETTLMLTSLQEWVKFISE